MCHPPAKRQARGKLQVCSAQKLSLREKLDPDTINRQMDAAKARWDSSVRHIACLCKMLIQHRETQMVWFAGQGWQGQECVCFLCRQAP